MSGARTILIVEDSAALVLTYQAQLKPLGHNLLTANTGKIALETLAERTIDCILLDLKLPDMDGMTILEKARGMPSPPSVIVVTANASLGTAVQAVRIGAYDYLVKPFPAARLLTTVTNALATTDLRREVETFRRTSEKAEFCGFVGRSLSMQQVYRTIDTAARSTASVFITGESGTGKEIAAEALHELSPRSKREFVALNCGAIPKDLMESVIFGHVKGAFTGATSDQEGAAARADGGTLFLDELGEMDPQLQTKLLRFIQTGSYDRVGENRTRRADIRFVAATNRSPEAAVHEGRLREDLYYRLNVVPLHMPPLRDRGLDIMLIARHFLQLYAESESRRFKAFAPEVEQYFQSYSWPGNVRQLQNVVRNIAVMHDGDVVEMEMLPRMSDGGKAAADIPTSAAPSPKMAPTHGAPLGFMPANSTDAIEPIAIAERRYIEQAIELCGGNIHWAARQLGISPSTIYRKKDGWS
jgi:two-component system repressor protein LuxO